MVMIPGISTGVSITHSKYGNLTFQANLDGPLLATHLTAVGGFELKKVREFTREQRPVVAASRQSGFFFFVSKKGLPHTNGITASLVKSQSPDGQALEIAKETASGSVLFEQASLMAKGELHREDFNSYAVGYEVASNVSPFSTNPSTGRILRFDKDNAIFRAALYLLVDAYLEVRHLEAGADAMIAQRDQLFNKVLGDIDYRGKKVSSFGLRSEDLAAAEQELGYEVRTKKVRSKSKEATEGFVTAFDLPTAFSLNFLEMSGGNLRIRLSQWTTGTALPLVSGLKTLLEEKFG